MTSHLFIELTAALFGVLGTVLLATNGPRAGFGFVAYLASNAGWIIFAWTNAHWGLLAQQVAFTAASLFGIWRWLLRDEWAMARYLYQLGRNSGRGRCASVMWMFRQWGQPW